MNRIAVALLSLSVVALILVGSILATESKVEVNDPWTVKIRQVKRQNESMISLEGSQATITASRITLRKEGEAPIEIVADEKGVQIVVSGHTIIRATELEFSTKLPTLKIEGARKLSSDNNRTISE